MLSDIGSAIAIWFFASLAALGLYSIVCDVARWLERRREPDPFLASSDPLEALWRLPCKEEAPRRSR